MTLLPHYQMFIDGAWCEGASGQVRDSINPATGAVWARFACADH
jgi:(Z)-2-((N-methylformamido)methylene)-5-hydroxybutyrolactone dehydrogenase